MVGGGIVGNIFRESETTRVPQEVAPCLKFPELEGRHQSNHYPIDRTRYAMHEQVRKRSDRHGDTVGRPGIRQYGLSLLG